MEELRMGCAGLRRQYIAKAQGQLTEGAAGQAVVGTAEPGKAMQQELQGGKGAWSLGWWEGSGLGEAGDGD